MKDRVVQYPHRYQLVPVAGETNVYDFVPVTGTVTEVGTPLNKSTLLSSSTETLYGLSDGTVDQALAYIPTLEAVKYYGKVSQLGGGVAWSTTSDALFTHIVTFSTEDIDDFSAINLGVSTSKITIPSGISKIKLYGKFNVYMGTKGLVKIEILKNNSVISEVFKSDVTATGSKRDLTSTFITEVMSVTQNDYFQLKISIDQNTATYDCGITAGTVFGMEVLG